MYTSTQLIKEIEEKFKEQVIEAFSSFPNLPFITWTQYSPYFNDGEACEFSYHFWSYDYKENKDAAESVWDKINEFGPFFLALFDDHSKVTVYRDGTVSVEEYEDHD